MNIFKKLFGEERKTLKITVDGKQTVIKKKPLRVLYYRIRQCFGR
jgi:hypothetical protein